MSFAVYPQPDACRAWMPTTPLPPSMSPPSPPMVCHMPKGHDGQHSNERRPSTLSRRWEGDARPAAELPAVLRVRIDTTVDIDPAAWREMQGEDFTGMHRSEIQELVTNTDTWAVWESCDAALVPPHPAHLPRPVHPTWVEGCGDACGCKTHTVDRCGELGCDCPAADFAAYDPGQFDYDAEEGQ